MNIPISMKGFNYLLEELEALKRERPVVAKEIQEAREDGDLSENGAYDAAREKQGMLEARISYIESRLPTFNVVDLNQLGGDKVIYGATVTLVDSDTDVKKQYTIVNPDESILVKNGISVLSPVARAIIGKEVGDEVMVTVPRGNIHYEIEKIEFLGEKLFKD